MVVEGEGLCCFLLSAFCPEYCLVVPGLTCKPDLRFGERLVWWSWVEMELRQQGVSGGLLL